MNLKNLISPANWYGLNTSIHHPKKWNSKTKGQKFYFKEIPTSTKPPDFMTKKKILKIPNLHNNAILQLTELAHVLLQPIGIYIPRDSKNLQ